MKSPKQISQKQYDAVMRQDLSTFLHRSFAELNPGTAYLDNWHIQVLADRLEQCRRGEIKRLLISLPTRSLKSHCVSIAFPAWLLAHDPSTQIICASYSQDLSEKLSRDCRTLMQSHAYCKIFGTRLSDTKQTAAEFVTTRQGFRMATSVGGTLTGRGADFIIIDDPQKPDEALSELSRERTIDWFKNTVSTRLNDKSKGCFIVVMQRLHEDDLIGHLEGQGGWSVLRFPAKAEETEVHTYRTMLGEETFTRRPGEALHPERESVELLNKMKALLGEYNFAGQYQQRPSPTGGGIVKLNWFRTYSSSDRPEKFGQVVQSWDTATSVSELADYSVCTTWGIEQKNAYLLNVHRERLEYPDLKRRVRALSQRYSPKVILIEDKASGSQLLQDLKRDGVQSLKAYQPNGDKILRLHTASSLVEGGFVHLPATADWLESYLQELASFPKGRKDDQVDSSSQFWDWFKTSRQEYGLIGYIQQEQRKLDQGIEQQTREQAEQIAKRKAWWEEKYLNPKLY